MISWIAAIGIAIWALVGCDRAPQKPKTFSVITTGAHSALLPGTESRNEGDVEADRDAIRLRGPGVHSHLQVRT